MARLLRALNIKVLEARRQNSALLSVLKGQKSFPKLKMT